MKIKDLQNQRTQKLIELDKIKTKTEAKDKELKELIAEISQYDKDFRSGKNFNIKSVSP